MSEQEALHLTRWTVTSGSNSQSRGAVVIQAGDHSWQASSEGNGAVDALYGAVDKALAEMLRGHPRLVAYDVHAVAEGPAAEGQVMVRIRPPESAEGARAAGEYEGESRGTNIIAASIHAYIEALNSMLGEAHWAGAADDAGESRRAASGEGRESAESGRAEFDRDKSQHDTTSWFEQ
ncbi:MAG: alpha-isopropylmalate synthase regulatory domain-containing protein [Chloroflexota bacterium]